MFQTVSEIMVFQRILKKKSVFLIILVKSEHEEDGGRRESQSGYATLGSQLAVVIVCKSVSDVYW